MIYLVVAYTLIAVVLIGYGISLHRRVKRVENALLSLESATK